MANRPQSFLLASVLLWSLAGTISAQSTLLPPQCAGKTGAQLDQCVRDITQPSGAEVFEPIEQKPDPRRSLNCNLAYSVDRGFCIARNEINHECANNAKYREFDACAGNLIGRQPLPGVADCARTPPAQRNQCALRNKVFRECQKEPWLYFICLSEKMSAR